MRFLVLAILLLGVSISCFSKSWHCRNVDFEIRCDSETCDISKEFTPMDVSVAETGIVDVCAYSGCWSGKGKIAKYGHHIMLSATNLRLGSDKTSTADFMVGIDTSDRLGFIKGEGFSMPINCSGH